MRPLDESTVVITGATGGLGRYLAGELASAGARVVVHGRDPDRVDRVADEVGAATGWSGILAGWPTWSDWRRRS